MDNPFGAYFASPDAAAPGRGRPLGKRRRRRRREAEPQTIGTNPEIWPPPEPEPFTDHPATATARTEPIYRHPDDEDGFTGNWNDWNDSTPIDPPRDDDVDWNDWATTTATEQSGDRVEIPVLPRLKDFGGGGPIARRPRKNFDDERYDDNGGRAKAAAAIKGIVGALVFVVLLGLAASIFLGPGDNTAAGTEGAVVSGSVTTGSPSTTTPPLPAHALPGCEAFRTQSITISAERGDTATPQGAILGFEYSYYVDRDAAKARTFVTDDAHVGDEPALAAGIATLPPDVKYCTHITRGDSTDPTIWHVTIHQQWPGDTTIEKIHQTMRTAEVSEGRYRITSIDHRR